MIWAWDIDTTLPDFARRYGRAALERGLLLRPIGRTLYLMPPYAIDPAGEDGSGAFLARTALEALEATLAQEGEVAPAPCAPSGTGAIDAV